MRRLNPAPVASAGGGDEIVRLVVETDGQTDFELGAVAVDSTGDPRVLGVTVVVASGASYPGSRADWQIDGSIFRWVAQALVVGDVIDVNYAPA